MNELNHPSSLKCNGEVYVQLVLILSVNSYPPRHETGHQTQRDVKHHHSKLNKPIELIKMETNGNHGHGNKWKKMEGRGWGWLALANTHSEPQTSKLRRSQGMVN